MELNWERRWEQFISTKSEETKPVSDEMETRPSVKRIGSKDVEWKRQKVYKLFCNNVELPEEENSHFCELPMQHHLVFCLEEAERGKTDLVYLKIDTCDAQPKK